MCSVIVEDVVLLLRVTDSLICFLSGPSHVQQVTTIDVRRLTAWYGAMINDNDTSLQSTENM